MGTETTLKTYADYQKFNFFRTPAWRWDRIVELVDRDDGVMGRCTKRDDEFVRAGRSFYGRWRNGDAEMRQKLLWENPGLFYAYDFHQKLTEDPDAVMYIQARLLARQTYDEIAEIMGVLPSAVEWFARLYFDVTDNLERRDWITKQILIPAMMRSTLAPVQTDPGHPSIYKDSTVAKPFMDGSLKMFAYFGGKHLVDVLISGMQAGRPMASQDDLAGWLDTNITNTLRRRTAQAAHLFEINKYNVMELFAVHTRIVEISQSDESKEQTKSIQERHIKAMMDEVPWAVGGEGSKMYKTHMGLLGHLDDMAGELRTDEVLRIASGQTLPDVGSDFPRQLPAPRRDKKAVLTQETTELP